MPFSHKSKPRTKCLGTLVALTVPFLGIANAEEVGERWGTADREREFYPIVDLPIPDDLVIEAGAFELVPNQLSPDQISPATLAVGTRHGDIFFVTDYDEPNPEPKYELYATGLDEIFGLAWKAPSLYVTQSCELTRLTDTTRDGKADRFDVVSDAWGYGSYHEYAFGSKFDPEGNLYVALGLSSSYHSRELFRGWGFKITPDAKSIPIASGMRSPGGIGLNEHGALFYMESQGPWNSSCSLKHVREGGFMGHPISFNWYPYAPELGPAPTEPNSGSSVIAEMERVPELVPYAIIFPYIRMGRSLGGFVIDRSGGKFGPFENQMFIGDYTQSLIVRATSEEVNGVWQGACYPFREGLSTGILNVQFTPNGHLLSGGTNRGWPVRGLKPYALERLDWSGITPFEMKEITITKRGFKIDFTKAVDPEIAGNPESYRLATFTHRYAAGYGGPEINQTEPKVSKATVAPGGLSVTLEIDGVLRGHVHEFHLEKMRSAENDELLHTFAFYTVNEIPK